MKNILYVLLTFSILSTGCSKEDDVQITQEVTCIADRGEFASSTNPTWSEGDTIRISEALLLDDNNNIIAVGRPDRHIEKTAQQFLAIGLKISV